MGSIGFKKLLTLMMVLASAALLVACRVLLRDMTPMDTRLILTAVIALGLLIIFLLLATRSSYQRQTQAQVLPNTDSWMTTVLEEFAPVLGIYIFGAGSIALRFVYFLDDIQCLPFLRGSDNGNGLILSFLFNTNSQDTPSEVTYSDKISEICLQLVTLTFFVFQMPLLKEFSRFQYRVRKSFIHETIVIVMAADVGIWLYVFMQDSGILSSTESNVPTEMWNLSMACQNGSTLLSQYTHDNLEHVLYPCTMEFTLVSLEVLMHVWLLDEVAEFEDDRTPLLPPETEMERPEAPPSKSSEQEYPADNPINGTQDSDVKDAAELNKTPIIQDETKPMIFDSDSTGDQSQYQRSNASLNNGQFVIHFTLSTEGVVEAGEPNRSLNERSQDNSDSDTVYQKVVSKMLSCFNLYTGLLFGILEAILLKYYILYHNGLKSREVDHESELHLTTNNSGSTEKYITVWYFDIYVNFPLMVYRILFSCLPSLAVSIFCWKVISSFNVIRATEPRLKGTYVMLVLAIVGVTLLTGFEIVIMVSKIGERERVWLFLLGGLEVLLYFPQYVIQALLIYNGHRRIPDTRHRYLKTLQGRLSYLAMYNFIHWATDSFLEIPFLTQRNELQAMMNDRINVWILFVHLFIPPCIYFRYLSTLQLLRVKRYLTEGEEMLNAIETNPTPTIESNNQPEEHNRNEEGEEGDTANVSGSATIPAVQLTVRGQTQNSEFSGIYKMPFGQLTNQTNQNGDDERLGMKAIYKGPSSDSETTSTSGVRSRSYGSMNSTLISRPSWPSGSDSSN